MHYTVQYSSTRTYAYMSYSKLLILLANNNTNHSLTRLNII